MGSSAKSEFLLMASLAPGVLDLKPRPTRVVVPVPEAVPLLLWREFTFGHASGFYGLPRTIEAQGEDPLPQIPSETKGTHREGGHSGDQGGPPRRQPGAA